MTLSAAAEVKEGVFFGWCPKCQTTTTVQPTPEPTPITQVDPAWHEDNRVAKEDVPYPITATELFNLLDSLGLDYEFGHSFEGVRVINFMVEEESEDEDV
jgi:hypothetical protein